MQGNDEIKSDFVESADGTVICYKVMGKGPGLVIVHGAFRGSQHYIRLASCLSESFTVYIVDRRGRNGSGEKGKGYSVQKGCEDVMAVLKKHDASYVFGHSFGGLVTLNLALQYPITKLAVYEPAMVPFIPTAWVSGFEKELKSKDFVSASVSLVKGLEMGGIIGKMPRFVLKPLFRAMAKGPEWEENTALLGTVPEEIRAAMLLDSDIGKYSWISAPALIMTGTKSPEYLKTIGSELEAVIPSSQLLSLKGLDHNAPDEREPEKIAQILKEFFNI